MDICFLFLKYRTDEGCLSLVLHPNGDVALPLKERHFTEIKELQNLAKTIVVLSAEHISFYYLELPFLPEKKARAAIPFALEEKLAEGVGELHFAFDRKHYQQGHYWVAVCNKAWLSQLIASLKALHITVHAFTADWFALSKNDVFLLDSNILVHDEAYFSGSLPATLAWHYLKNNGENQKIYRFTDTSPNLISIENSAEKETADSHSSLWIAQQLQKRPFINFCQGALEQGDNSKIRRWYWAVAIVGALWLLSFILFKSISIYKDNRELQSLDHRITAVYRHFFPGATQVISPKFRITQLLKTQKKDTNRLFWTLLNTLSLAIKNNSSVLIEHMQFQNKVLQVTLSSKDFNDLETLQNSLKKAALQVKQLEASSKDEKVIATLELSL